MQNYAYIAQFAPHIKEVPMNSLFGDLGWELGIDAPIGMGTPEGNGRNTHSTEEERKKAREKKEEERRARAQQST